MFSYTYLCISVSKCYAMLVLEAYKLFILNFLPQIKPLSTIFVFQGL